MEILSPRKPTREVQIGTASIGHGQPVLLQSMAATKTTDVEATAKTCERLRLAGAGLVRVAADSRRDAEALQAIRAKTTANLVVDLQENYRLAELVAPFVDKIRYNPGHLHHAEKEVSWQKKVAWLVDVCHKNACAIRIGVNCGSLGPNTENTQDGDNPMLRCALDSALKHAAFVDSLGFTQFCVSIKSSDPRMVVEANRRFSELRSDIPLHLGVTEAGMPPEGVFKSRVALEPLLSEGIGDTLRVSLTVPNERKNWEIEAGQEILRNVERGTTVSLANWKPSRLNIVSCPSCARVENERFIALAEEIRAAMLPFNMDSSSRKTLTIAVMGCRVNGPGETNHADLGLWCGPETVHFKRGEELLDRYSYGEIVPRLLDEVTHFVDTATE